MFSLVAQTVKNLPAMQDTWVQSLGGEDPLKRGMATHSSMLAWRIHGQRSLAGYSPWGCKELDMTEQLSLTHLFSFLENLFLKIVETVDVCNYISLGYYIAI